MPKSLNQLRKQKAAEPIPENPSKEIARKLRESIDYSYLPTYVDEIIRESKKGYDVVSLVINQMERDLDTIKEGEDIDLEPYLKSRLLLSQLGKDILQKIKIAVECKFYTPELQISGDQMFVIQVEGHNEGKN